MSHFNASFQQDKLPLISLLVGSFKKLDNIVASLLKRIPCDEEIKLTLWRCDPSKAPLYNGFNIKFVKECWDIIGKEISQFIKYLFNIGIYDPFINKHGLLLSQKSQILHPLRNISLLAWFDAFIRSFLKYITTGLKQMMGIIISENQTGFVL